MANYSAIRYYYSRPGIAVRLRAVDCGLMCLLHLAGAFMARIVCVCVFLLLVVKTNPVSWFKLPPNYSRKLAVKSRRLTTLVVAERRPVTIGGARATGHRPGNQATAIYTPLNGTNLGFIAGSLDLAVGSHLRRCCKVATIWPINHARNGYMYTAV